MNIYDTIKAAVSVPQAAAYYGMKIQRNNMTRCCFHDDHHPSLKLNDTYFYCFACLEHGDVIDLVAQLHRESHYAAVHRIARDFGIGPNTPAPAAAKPHIPHRDPDEALCMSVLIDYEQLLKRWKLDYAPATADAPIDDRFMEACQMLPIITAMTNILFLPDADLRARLVRKVMQDNTIPRLKERLDKLREEEADDNESAAAAA